MKRNMLDAAISKRFGAGGSSGCLLRGCARLLELQFARNSAGFRHGHQRAICTVDFVGKKRLQARARNAHHAPAPVLNPCLIELWKPARD